MDNFIDVPQTGEPKKTTGPVKSNTDSGSKRGVYCRDTRILYLALLFRNLYPNFINVKGEQFSIDSLITSLLFEQDKIKNSLL